MPRRTRSTPSRKQQHVALTLKKDVGFRLKTTGLEQWEFVHNALPEIHLAEVDLSTSFLGKRISAPLMISCMTGGYKDALTINRQLAETCEHLNIAMGVGSQRQAIENAQYHKTFSVVREGAPTIPIVGNIGAAEVAAMTSADAARKLIDLINADAFTVHLNPLQEFLQPEGNTNFRGVLRGIELLVRQLSVPVIVKEIGAGLSADVCKRLLDVGVRHIDVAGAGGTSWAGVETLRRTEKDVAIKFWDWGIPTAVALRQAAALRSTYAFTLIASGGIGSGFEAAKCIALGADIAASARPMIKQLQAAGKAGLRRLIAQWIEEIRGIMFLTGSTTIADLQKAPLVRYT
ncbi:MAG: type 2 isopentenyl-diphosphate Delta-isomerase [Ignavibacteriae bacterium]|nr:type 2 isopentenyl-diphosphate Delta-isomerase [Ignavibacteriota bacterium]